MSAAFKQAILQAFCVPAAGNDDPDAVTHRLVAKQQVLDPDQGWDQWAFDIQDMIRVCETTEAIDRVQSTYRSLFQAAAKRRPDIYKAIGRVIQGRRALVTPKAGDRSLVTQAEKIAKHIGGDGTAAAQVADA